MKKLCCFLLLGSFLALNAQSPPIGGSVLVQLEAGMDWQADFAPEVTGAHLILPDLNIWSLELSSDELLDLGIVDSLRQRPEVLQAQLNRQLFLRDSLPNDSLFHMQWQYRNVGQNGGATDADIDAEAAWAISQGGITPSGDSIVVCIIDDGWAPHPDLLPNLWYNRYEVPNNGLDDDGNGFIDDRRGWNVYQDNDDVTQGGRGGGHAVPLMGLIGARGNNEEGVVGVNWRVKLMPVVGGFLTEAHVLAAYAYPLAMRKLYNQTHGARGAFVVAVNASWGRQRMKPEEAPLWCNLFDTLGQHGILTIASTANERIDVDQLGDMPCACPSPYLIAVTSSDHLDRRQSYTGFGRFSIDLAAPGEGAFSTAGTNRYMHTGGTSAAAPLVSGAVALLYSLPDSGLARLSEEHPALAALKVKDWILQGVDSLPQFEGVVQSGGRLNLAGAMYRGLDESPGLFCPSPAGLQLRPQSGGGASLHWEMANADSLWLHWRAEGEGWQEIAISTSTDSLLLPLLQPCKVYQFRMQARCGADLSPSSRVFSFAMPCASRLQDLQEALPLLLAYDADQLWVSHPRAGASLTGELIDSQGRRCWQGTFRQEQFDLSPTWQRLPPGLYVIRGWLKEQPGSLYGAKLIKSP
jgi:serine protease